MNNSFLTPRWLRIMGWILIILTLFLISPFISIIAQQIYIFGDCVGGLGSGIVCAGGQFWARVLGWIEIGYLFGSTFLLIPLYLIVVVLGLSWHVWLNKKDTSHLLQTVLTTPYFYLLVLALFGILNYFGFSLSF